MKPIVIPVVQGSPEWLAWRHGGYGSSDVPTLLNGGEKAWRELHAIKLGILDDPEATEPMRWGRELEGTIARAYAEREGERVQKMPYGLQHPELPAVRASLDRRRRRGRVAVELKAWSFKSADFGPDHSDQVPESMYAQVQQQLLVTGWERADLAVFFGSSKRLEVYRLGRDPELIDSLVSIETGAWAHVARGAMPPWPGPAETRPILKADEIPADDELIELVTFLQVAQRQAESASEAVDAVKNRIRQRLEEAGGTRGELPDGRRFSIAFRPTKEREQTAWEHVAAAYRKALEQVSADMNLSERLRASLPDLDAITSALTVISPGPRPLRVTVSTPKESPDANAA